MGGFDLRSSLPLLYFVISCVALYLSFRRNNGFKLGPFLVALFFWPIYILYAIAVPVRGQFSVFKGE
jgi:hypothetical protein